MHNQSFQIHNQSKLPLPCLVLKDPQSGITASILPDHGALLNQFSIPLPDEPSGRLEVVSGYTSPEDLARNEFLFYRSAKLSPFVCRIAEARYRIGNQTYEFPKKFKDGSAIHGIISDKKFSVEQTSADQHMATALLKHEYGGENPGYPFSYAITVKYTLKDKGRLEIESTIENRSAETIPVADGWHPYFSLGGNADYWELVLNCHEMLELNAKLVPSGVRTPLSRFRKSEPIGTAALDNCFIVDPERGELPAAILSNPRYGMQLSFFPDIHYPFLQIYTPEDRLSIAIENLSSAPDSFNNGIGLTWLAPRERQSFTVTYQLSQTESSTLQP